MTRADCLVLLLIFVLLGGALQKVQAEEMIFQVAGFESGAIEEGVPVGWDLVKFKGIPKLGLQDEGELYALRLMSDKSSSFGIKKNCEIEIGVYTHLNWRWKVHKLPEGGDVREASKDDQALQVYVYFDPLGWPARLNTPMIGYVWDSDAPRDTVVKSAHFMADKVRYIVLRNKNDRLFEWHSEKRNVFEDYERLFPDIEGGKPRNIKGISFFINSQNTGSEAESYIYNVFFSSS